MQIIFISLCMMLLAASVTISWHHVCHLERMVVLSKAREDGFFRFEGALVYAVWCYEHGSNVRAKIMSQKDFEIEVPGELRKDDMSVRALFRLYRDDAFLLTVSVVKKDIFEYTRDFVVRPQIDGTLKFEEDVCERV